MPDARSLNVLVVDDQQTMRGMARQCLKRLGIVRVTLAASGDAALGEMQHQRFDAVISDLNMAGMTGLDLAASIRAHPVLRSVPVFVTTSEVYCDDLDRTHISGVIPKPFSVASMKSALEDVIGTLS
jgi:two-component system chemotaxis response regulator CheY